MSASVAFDQRRLNFHAAQWRVMKKRKESVYVKRQECGGYGDHVQLKLDAMKHEFSDVMMDLKEENNNLLNEKLHAMKNDFENEYSVQLTNLEAKIDKKVHDIEESYGKNVEDPYDKKFVSAESFDKVIKTIFSALDGRCESLERMFNALDEHTESQALKFGEALSGMDGKMRSNEAKLDEFVQKTFVEKESFNIMLEDNTTSLMSRLEGQLRLNSKKVMEAQVATATAIESKLFSKLEYLSSQMMRGSKFVACKETGGLELQAQVKRHKTKDQG